MMDVMMGVMMDAMDIVVAMVEKKKMMEMVAVMDRRAQASTRTSTTAPTTRTREFSRGTQGRGTQGREKERLQT
jgi:hypothetical protein